jgi:hypothetical protein
VQGVGGGRFSRVQCQGAHAVDVSDVSQAAYNCAQIGGHGSLQGEQGEGVAFGLGGLKCKFLVGDHGFGRDDVGLEKGFGGLLHRGAGEATHVADAACQRVELLVKRRPHMVNVRTQRRVLGWL